MHSWNWICFIVLAGLLVVFIKEVGQMLTQFHEWIRMKDYRIGLDSAQALSL